MNQTVVTILRLQQHSSSTRGRGLSQKQIDELRATLPSNVLRRLDYLAQRGRGPIAILSDADACGCCHMRLPHGVGLEIRGMPEDIHNCPYCGCFLYAPISPEAPAAPLIHNTPRLRP